MRMSKIITAALAITLISATASVAQPAHRDFNRGDRIERQVDRQVYRQLNRAAYRADRRAERRYRANLRADWRQFRHAGKFYRYDRNEFRRFYRGQRFHFNPQRHVVIDNWYHHHLHHPPLGYHWVRNGNTGDYLLVALTTGVILNLMFGHY